eukprot:606843-Pleurochrysis_carterae.AAC.1
MSAPHPPPAHTHAPPFESLPLAHLAVAQPQLEGDGEDGVRARRGGVHRRRARRAVGCALRQNLPRRKRAG